jgi:hypothetical protein
MPWFGIEQRVITLVQAWGQPANLSCCTIKAPRREIGVYSHRHRGHVVTTRFSQGGGRVGFHLSLLAAAYSLPYILLQMRQFN